MSYLIFDCQSLNYPKVTEKAKKKDKLFLFTFDEWIDDRATDLDKLVIAVFLIIVAAIFAYLKWKIHTKKYFVKIASFSFAIF